MRRSLAALLSGLILVTLNGCGGGGDPGPKSAAPTNSEPTASIPGPTAVTVANLPAEIVLPGEILPPIEDDSKRLVQARQQIDKVNEAVLRYIAKKKTAPGSLEALAQPGEDGSPAYLDHGMLVDPWGASLQFEATGARNKNKQPDVWSLGPPSGTVFIGNWSDKPTPAEEIK